MYGGQSTAPGTLLLILGAAFPGRFGQNPPLGDEDHVLSTELLLQLPHQTHLDLLEGLQLRNGNEDDDGFPAATNLNFLCCSDVQLSQLSLQVGVHLQLEQSLGDPRLKL